MLIVGISKVPVMNGDERGSSHGIVLHRLALDLAQSLKVAIPGAEGIRMIGGDQILFLSA